MRLKHLSEGRLASLFLGTNNKAAQLSIAEYEQRLVLHHNGCYRCSFLHPIIALNKERAE